MSNDSLLVRLLCGLSLCICVSQATAQTTECRLDNLTRSVDIVYSNPGQPVPCEVVYEKPSEGGLQTLWRADREAGYCEAKAAEFVAKLSGWGWDCGSTDAEPALEASTAMETEPAAEQQSSPPVRSRDLERGSIVKTIRSRPDGEP